MKKVLGLIVFGLVSLYAQKIVSSGEVLVNGEQLTSQTVISIGDFIETKKGSKVKFNIGEDAFLANENSKFKFTNTNGVKTLDVVTGGVLSVFKKGEGKHEVKTSNMTAGIRGTAVYLERKENKDYFCTCYGETHLNTQYDEMSIKAHHHNMVWIKDGKIKPTSDKVGHEDDDLRDLEAFVGRIPEFDQK